MDSNLLAVLGELLFSVMNVLPFIVGTVGYVLMAMGLYTLAKERNISGAWLSWVPGLQVWVLGSLSDQYRYVAKGQRTNRRKILLGLKIAGWVVSAIALGLSITGVTRIIFNLFDPTVVVSEEAMLRGLLRWAMKSIGFAIVLFPITVAGAVFYFMSIYDLYMSCDPHNAVLYLVFSILVGFIRPIFVFLDRNKELGMPPRKPQPQCCRFQASAPEADEDTGEDDVFAEEPEAEPENDPDDDDFFAEDPETEPEDDPDDDFFAEDPEETFPEEGS